MSAQGAPGSLAPVHRIQGREVRMPVMVRRASSGSATFLVKSAAARGLIRGQGLDVAEVLPGRALCSIAIIDYADNDLGDYHEVSIALFAVLLSVGEAFWSPRLYEYTAAVAPQGRVGSYMALSLLPYFLAQFGVGMLSGRLLAAYVPEHGARDPSTLWLIVAAMAAVCPLGLLAFRRWLRVPEAGR